MVGTRVRCAFFVAAAIACSMTANRGIEIPGDSSEERSKLAQEVYQSVRASSDSEKELRKYAPDVPDELLARLRLRPFHIAGASLRGGKFDKFYLQCSLTTWRTDEAVKDVLDACELVVREHLNQVLEKQIRKLEAASRRGSQS
jgi:hypothetical protein